MKKLLVGGMMLLALPGLAQMGRSLGVPASATSITPQNPTPGVPPSVTSFRTSFTAFHPAPPLSTGFSAFNPPPSMGFTTLGSDVFPVRRRSDDAGFGGHQGRFHHRRRGGFVTPVYYPVYTYPVYTQPQPEAEPEAAAYDAPSGNALDRELWSRAAEREDRALDRRDAHLAQEDPRYGEHYLDSRENRRRTPDGGESSGYEEPGAPETQLILVLRDGTRLELGNYAIMGQTIFDLGAAESHKKKIQVAELDLPATEKANDERGLEFKLPSRAR
ncbi:MAG TPA: hypothetical protein VLA96_04415 [Terriglobales bacterium]|nr:hypothetical protein [Terriglobales bacterium]